MQSARESVRQAISAVEVNLRQARDESEQLFAELQELESSSLPLQGQLDALTAELALHDEEIARLDRQQAKAEADIAQARALLARQLRTTYITGRQSLLKLALNQEDPARLSRLIAYHDYFNQARSRQITTIAASLQRIAEIKPALAQAGREQRALLDSQQARLGELALLASRRQQLLTRLNKHITHQNDHLQALRRTETELSQLLQALAGNVSADAFDNLPPFGSLKGQLSLPVDGQIDTAFGEYKKGGRLKATGVTFNTQKAAAVTAVAGGQVIFADWFRNLGLLLIIDHGDDYMSLYGHNATIAMRKGDWVAAGERIATAGESGGRRQAGLYFEIRRRGTPLNPLQWCKRPQPASQSAAHTVM